MGELTWESGASGVWIARSVVGDRLLVRRFRSSRAGVSPGTFGWRLLVGAPGRPERLVSTHATRREAQEAGAEVLRGRR